MLLTFNANQIKTYYQPNLDTQFFFNYEAVLWHQYWPALGQWYLIAVAYGLGSSPSTPVQLYIPISLFLMANGASVQLMAEK